jgi:hypothetical protein
MAGNRQQATDVAKLQQAQRHMEKLQAAVESDRLVAAAEARRYTAQLTQTRQGAQEAREEVMAPGLKKATIVELQATIAEALSEVEQHKATTAEQQAAMAALQASLAHHSQQLLYAQAKVAPGLLALRGVKGACEFRCAGQWGQPKACVARAAHQCQAGCFWDLGSQRRPDGLVSCRTSVASFQSLNAGWWWRRTPRLATAASTCGKSLGAAPSRRSS